MPAPLRVKRYDGAWLLEPPDVAERLKAEYASHIEGRREWLAAHGWTRRR